MSKRFFNLFCNEFDARWQYTDSKTNATLIAQMSPTARNGKEIHHLDGFNLTIRNLNTLDLTMTAHVRDASVAGTILAQWPLVLKGSQVAQVSPAGLHLVATKGAAFFVTTDTVQPSVTAAVNACGWVDEGESY